MTKEREKFRKSRTWLEFRAKLRLKVTKDFITKDPLTKTWNLHHLDLRVQHYDKLEDENRFLPLNKKTHEMVHELFKVYKRDRQVLERLKKVLDLMLQYTED